MRLLLSAGGSTIVRLCRIVSLPPRGGGGVSVMDHDGLRLSLLGCLRLLMRERNLLPYLCEIGAPLALRQLSTTPSLPLSHRLTTLSTLDAVAAPLAKLEESSASPLPTYRALRNLLLPPPPYGESLREGRSSTPTPTLLLLGDTPP